MQTHTHTGVNMCVHSLAMCQQAGVHGAMVVVLLKDTMMLFHHFLFLLCVALPAVVGHCWDSPGQPRGHTGQRGGSSAHCSSPASPTLQGAPSKWELGCIFLFLGNPKTAEMLVPRREEEPGVTPWQQCPSHLSDWPLAAGTTGPPTVV